MVLTILSVLLFIFFFIADRKINEYGDNAFYFFGLICSGAFVVVIFCFLTLGRMDSKKFVLQFIETQKTITEQRNKSQTDYERATLTKVIVDTNREMVSQQFFAGNIWTNWFFDKSVLNLKSIK